MCQDFKNSIVTRVLHGFWDTQNKQTAATANFLSSVFFLQALSFSYDIVCFKMCQSIFCTFRISNLLVECLISGTHWNSHPQAPKSQPCHHPQCQVVALAHSHQIVLFPDIYCVLWKVIVILNSLASCYTKYKIRYDRVLQYI